jgi:hypothetical protein
VESIDPQDFLLKKSGVLHQYLVADRMFFVFLITGGHQLLNGLDQIVHLNEQDGLEDSKIVRHESPLSTQTYRVKTVERIQSVI